MISQTNGLDAGGSFASGYPALRKIWAFLAWLSVLLVMLDSSLLESFPSWMRQIWFVALFFLILCVLAFLPRSKVRILPLLLVFVAFFSVISNDIPNMFSPYSRLIYFIVMLGVIGPLFYHKALVFFHEQLWKAALCGFSVAVLMSFVCYLLRIEECFDNQQHLLGVFTHSMNLATVAGCVSIFLLAVMLDQFSKNKKLFLLVGSLFVISLLVCLLAGSRAAFVACLIAYIFLIWLSPRIHRAKYWLFSLGALFALAVALYAVLLAYGYFDLMMEKNEYAMEHGSSLLFTRAYLWQARWDEFCSSPLTGIGFASVNLYSTDRIVWETGQIEPGSSWLFVFSSIGIFGGIFVLLLWWLPFLRLFRSAWNEGGKKALILAIMLFFGIHMLAEGYLLSAGNISFFLVWTTLTVAWDLLDQLNKNPDKAVPFGQLSSVPAYRSGTDGA